MSSFHDARSTLHSVLISMLIVFGHLLVASLVSPAINLDRVPVPDDDHLANTTRRLSVLTFLTMLWLTFSLLEWTDLYAQRLRSHPSGVSPESTAGGRDVDDTAVFGRTWVEVLLASVVTTGWTGLLSGVYYTIVLCLLVIDTHLIGSIASYMLHAGPSEVLSRGFWNGTTGHWAERVELVSEAEEEREKGVV